MRISIPHLNNKIKVEIKNKWFFYRNPDFLVVVFLFLFYAFLFSVISIIRHNHFQSQGIDFSIYDQSLWLYSKLETPFSTVTNLHDLADRFRPIMLPLSTLYWFTQNERILLLFQSTILAAAIFPIWLIARRYLPRVLALIVAFLYIDFIGIQAAVVAEFHEMTLLPFFLSWMFYFMLKEKWKFYFIFLILSLSVREHVGFLLSTLALFILLTKKQVKIAVLTFFISIIWSLVAIQLIMPALGQVDYSSFVSQSDSLGSAIKGYLYSPQEIVTNTFLPFEKSKTLFWSFLSFGFFPIFYIPLLLTIAFNFLSRFLDQLHPVRWTLFWHYSVEVTVLMSISTIFVAKHILKKYKNSKKLIILIAIFLLTTHAVTNLNQHTPLKNLLKPQFYSYESWMTHTKLVIGSIPKKSSVASQNNLLPHLSHRKEIYLLPNNKEAEYIVLDLHEGQNNWNFYTLDTKSTKSLMKQLVLLKSYKIILSVGDTYLLKSNFDKSL